jgi:hypothetical protein
MQGSSMQVQLYPKNWTQKSQEIQRNPNPNKTQKSKKFGICQPKNSKSLKNFPKKKIWISWDFCVPT